MLSSEPAAFLGSIDGHVLANIFLLFVEQDLVLTSMNFSNIFVELVKVWKFIRESGAPQ